MNLSFFNRLPDKIFSIKYMPFWVETLTEAMKLHGPETDADLERLKQHLREYWAGAETDPKIVDRIPGEIWDLKYPGLWRDGTPLGIKYRCLYNMAFSREKYQADPANCDYGLDTAVRVINLHEDAVIDQALTALAEENAAKYGIDLWTEEIELPWT